ncbi:MAG: hypothetical protein L0H53_13365 [Candidatus Nitrosocosmicus sp.]|nr:hypothetical protein [Candidatus Nitrosocosmicus sp.]MDN5866103.1 hypothetical protein [Candidatus Nitrosocosmicus sp.]
MSISNSNSHVTKYQSNENSITSATKFSNLDGVSIKNDPYNLSIQENCQNTTQATANFSLTRTICGEISEGITKYYINNPSRLIKTAVRSGGVEAAAPSKHSNRTVRLSISPSQGNNVMEDKLSDQRIVQERSNIIKEQFNDPDFWTNFEKYLPGFNTKKTIRSRLSYAKRYYSLLLTESFDGVLRLSRDKVNHIMKALSSLSKYLGIYDKWNQIIKKYNLKWSQKDSLETFNKIFSASENIDSYLSGIKDFLRDRQIPIECKNLVIFCTLTGLRVSEALDSVRILKDRESRSKYLDIDKKIIKHYIFAETFIRNTKRAYFSVINDDILRVALASYSESYSSLQSHFYRNGIPLKISCCRKVFATYLRSKGIESEIIDILQGRIDSNSVFVNHYYRPEINEIITKRIRPILDELMSELVT